MQELWQLYDEHGSPMPGKGATKDEAFSGLLHGAAQVWMWRRRNGKVEVLVQKRAAGKRTWPNLLDISAAGHINLGETPIEAAIRETKEELGLTIQADDLKLINETKEYMVADNGDIENELVWFYSLELKDNHTFTLQTEEVDSLLWKSFDDFRTELRSNDSHKLYVPHSPAYYEAVLAFIDKAATA